MIHSYSKINTWKNCPRQYHERYIAKRFPFVETPQIKKGREQHSILEYAIKGEGDIPAEICLPENFIPWLQSLDAQPEVRMALDRNGNSCDFFDSNVWIRGVIDVFAWKGDIPVLVDWKTGRSDYTDWAQAAVYAAMVKHLTNKRVLFIFSYVKHGINKKTLLNPEKSWLNIKQMLETIEADSEWLPRPSGLCGWCPVTTCEHH